MAKVNFSTYTGNLANAWAAIKANGGTIVFDEQSRQLSGATQSLIPDFPKQVPLMLRGDDGSNRIEINKGSANIGFYMGNLTSAVIRDMLIHGVAGGGIDCAQAIAGAYLYSLKIEDSIIGGISANDCVILINDAAWGHLSNVQLSGNAGQAVVKMDGGRHLLCEGVHFYDYQNIVDVYHSKTPVGVGSWIECIDPAGGPGANEHTIVVRDSRFDEGALNGIKINGYKSFTSERNGFNVNGTTLGYGINLTNVANAVSLQDHFGYTTIDRPAVIMVNSTLRADAMTFDGAVNRIVLDSTSKLEITNSPGVVIQAATGAVVKMDGVTKRSGVVQIG